MSKRVTIQIDDDGLIRVFQLIDNNHTPTTAEDLVRISAHMGKLARHTHLREDQPQNGRPDSLAHSDPGDENA